MEDHSFLSDFFANQKVTLKKCWEPTRKCTKRAIRAHSIQNSRVIELGSGPINRIPKSAIS
jgi:hypothetical protein